MTSFPRLALTALLLTAVAVPAMAQSELNTKPAAPVAKSHVMGRHVTKHHGAIRPVAASSTDAVVAPVTKPSVTAPAMSTPTVTGTTAPVVAAPALGAAKPAIVLTTPASPAVPATTVKPN